MKKLLTTALAGLASVALIAVNANAQTVTTNIGDLVLGFRITDNAGQGATQNLEVDLGNMSTFTSLAAGQTINPQRFVGCRSEYDLRQQLVHPL
jgi:hypothetical protein